MKTRFWKAVVFAFLAIGLVGCTTTSSIVDGTTIGEGDGLLAVKIISNAGNGALSYTSSETADKFGKLSQPQGSLYIKRGEPERVYVVPVKAGRYFWSFYDNNYYKALFQQKREFSIRPHTITYVGDLDMQVQNRVLYSKVVDRRDDMWEYIRARYPSYAAKMDFVVDIAR